MTCAMRLAMLREESGLSRQQICQKLQMPYNTYRNYEAGTREPNHEVLGALSDLFCVSTDYLLGRTEVRQPSLALSEDESRLIVSFRQLDERGRHTVSDSAASQLAFCEAIGHPAVHEVTPLPRVAELPIAARGGVSAVTEEDKADAERIRQMYLEKEQP